MIAAKKQQPVIAPAPEEQVAAGMTVAMGIIEAEVDRQKASNPGLPRQVIHGMVTHHNPCPCRIALHLLEQERKSKERERQ